MASQGGTVYRKTELVGTSREGFDDGVNRAFHEYMVSLAKNNALLEAYRRLSVEGIVWRVMQRMLDKFEYADEAAVTDHRRLVEAYESEDVAYAKSVIVGHTERAKRVYQRAIELSGGLV